MYRLIGKVVAVEEKAEALIEILRTGIRNMPGCFRYIISKDANDRNAVWVTEIWNHHLYSDRCDSGKTFCHKDEKHFIPSSVHESGYTISSIWSATYDPRREGGRPY